MKAAIFTLDTESYRARKASAAGVVLKKMLEQAGFETGLSWGIQLTAESRLISES